MSKEDVQMTKWQRTQYNDLSNFYGFRDLFNDPMVLRMLQLLHNTGPDPAPNDDAKLK